MRVAATSALAEELTKTNIATALDIPFVLPSMIDDLYQINPDVVVLGGCFVREYSDLQLFRQMVGDAKKAVIVWMGFDIAHTGNFLENGERWFFDWLRDDMFCHIPVSMEVKGLLEERLNIDSVSPLSLPSEKLLDFEKKPEDFTIGFPMPAGEGEIWNKDILNKALSNVKGSRVIMFDWMPPFKKEEMDVEFLEFRYSMNREEYEQTIKDCSCLVRLPGHYQATPFVQDFLMSGRPVLSNYDYPNWPAKLKTGMKPQEIADVIDRSKQNGKVAKTVVAFYRSQSDPSKYRERFEQRVQEKWPEFSFEVTK